MSSGSLRVTIMAEQPLALGIGSEVSFFTDSHSFVPGSVLRGALAATWIAEYGPPVRSHAHVDRFRELFDGLIRYGPLYVEGGQREPLSVLHCKYPETQACEATAVDLAFEHRAACAGCGKGLEPSKGQLFLPPGLAMHRRVRTSIDPKTWRAKDSELYATAAIPVGTTLVGTIHGTHPWLSESRTLRLGGRRSVGGAAGYQTEPSSPVLPVADQITDALVIRLDSPAILVDQGGRPRLDPDPDLDLCHEATLDRAWSRPLRWEGWHAASRLPKPLEICAAAGSTYRVTGNHDDLVRLATRLLRDGIGLRRAEGFGVVEVAYGPWRRTKPENESPSTVDTSIHERMKILDVLGLEAPERRWLIGALRGLQGEGQRSRAQGSGLPLDIDTTLDELLRQPAAVRLSGPQREHIRTAVTNLSAEHLRDLTTLAIANLGPGESPASNPGVPE
jgi:CRISPR-associated protein Csx10